MSYRGSAIPRDQDRWEIRTGVDLGRPEIIGWSALPLCAGDRRGAPRTQLRARRAGHVTCEDGNIPDVNEHERGAPPRAGRDHQPRGDRPSRPRVSVETYRDDPMYPTIVRAVAAILTGDNKVVAPVDVIVRMDGCRRTISRAGGSGACPTSSA